MNISVPDLRGASATGHVFSFRLRKCICDCSPTHVIIHPELLRLFDENALCAECLQRIAADPELLELP